MTILDEVIQHKRREVAARREQISRRELERSALFDAPRRSVVKALHDSDQAGIIAEFKRRSPSKGWFNKDANAAQIAKDYNAAGASALSILTDQQFFAGANEDLTTARAAVELPILRKDFVVEEFQIIEARALGADCILLIAAALSEIEIKKLAAAARNIGLEVLLEVHSREEIPTDLTDISIVGVNNRNLKDFSVDLNRSLEIAASLPVNLPKISESGLSDARDIVTLRAAGFKGFLIGETFMKTDNPGAACAEFIEQIVKDAN